MPTFKVLMPSSAPCAAMVATLMSSFTTSTSMGYVRCGIFMLSIGLLMRVPVVGGCQMQSHTAPTLLDFASLDTSRRHSGNWKLC
uniref:Uncharacterized protein n=1 Tax=Arundo donax TaxID=35708 RepID=A0A0A9FIN9_ARUDO